MNLSIHTYSKKNSKEFATFLQAASLSEMQVGFPLVIFTPTQKNSKEFAHCCKSTAEMQVGFPLVIFIAWIFISSRLMMEALTVVISKKESFSSYQKTRSNELKIRFDLNLILLTVS